MSRYTCRRVKRTMASCSLLMPLHPVPGNQKVGAVGSQVLPGHAANCVHPRRSPPPSLTHCINPMGVLILAVIVLGLALASVGGHPPSPA